MKKAVMFFAMFCVFMSMWSCNDILKTTIDQSVNGYTEASIKVNDALIEAKVNAGRRVIESEANLEVAKNSANEAFSRLTMIVAVMVVAVFGFCASILFLSYSIDFSLHKAFRVMERSSESKLTLNAYKETYLEQSSGHNIIQGSTDLRRVS